MYVLIVFNRGQDKEIDAVLGPFESTQLANDKYYELFGLEYRHTKIVKLTDELPEWAK